jgi:hypothetical protein
MLLLSTTSMDDENYSKESNVSEMDELKTMITSLCATLENKIDEKLLTKS